MLKQRIVKVIVGLALLAAVGGTGVVADSFGLVTISQAHACSAAGSSGGGC